MVCRFLTSQRFSNSSELPVQKVAEGVEHTDGVF